MITNKDRGKTFYLDGNKSTQVQLFDIMPDNWVKIVYPDGRHINVTLNRLTRIDDEIPIDELLDYPEKAVKVTIDVQTEDGIMVKVLEGEDAVKWNAWMRELCYRATELGINPSWLDLDWHITKKAP